MMTSFRILMLAATAAIVAVTGVAVAQMGLLAAITTFSSDLGHPWRAQFYSDLEIHLLLTACWMIYRERSKAAGVCCGLAAIVLGAVFTAPYILIASFRAKGDATVLLTGRTR
jgi:hypothetical protein